MSPNGRKRGGFKLAYFGTSNPPLFGPSELQHRHHAELELMYLAAAERFGLEGLQVPAFNDPLLYAGAPPSVQYCKSMFTDWFASVRIYLERTISRNSSRWGPYF
jgi:hypothetical protein